MLFIQADVRSLVQEFEDVGSPFEQLDEKPERVDLDESIIMPPEVLEDVRNVKVIGERIYQEFQQKRIFTQDEAFTAPLKRCRLRLFKYGRIEPQTSQKSSVTAVKDSQAKTAQILLAANAGRHVTELFKHESNDYPPALTRKGKLHHGAKSEILDLVTEASTENQPQTSCAVLDGAVLVQMLRPRNVTTIEEYCSNVFIPYILKYFENNQRVDVIWDVYVPNSLKAGTREQRGTGNQRRVTLATKIPGNWASFLRVDQNKQKLFVLLADQLSKIHLPEVIISLFYNI